MAFNNKYVNNPYPTTDPAPTLCQVDPKMTMTSSSLDARTMDLGNKQLSPSTTPTSPTGSTGPKAKTTSTPTVISDSYDIEISTDSLLVVNTKKPNTKQSLSDEIA